MTISHVITQFHTPPDREGAKFLKKGQKVSRGGERGAGIFQFKGGGLAKKGLAGFYRGAALF